MPDQMLTIGELARRAGVATSTLRYWEEFDLLPTVTRISGQRHYPESAVRLVGIILLLRDVGFSLAEQQALTASHAVTRDDWQRLARRKLAELDERIAKAQAARQAIDHALHCPHDDVFECPNFADVVTARLTGQPLHESHAQPPAIARPESTFSTERPTTRTRYTTLTAAMPVTKAVHQIGNSRDRNVRGGGNHLCLLAGLTSV